MRKHLAAILACIGATASAQSIFTVAGIPYTHRNAVDSQPALKAPLGSVYGVLADNLSGRLLINDEYLLLRLEPDGTLLALAGSGPMFNRVPQFFVNGPPATTIASAMDVELFRGMAQDAAGAVYISDAFAGRVYRISPDGTVITFAGGGSEPPGFQSDGGRATAARLDSPRGLVFDSKGNLDIAEVFCNCIRQVTPSGIISTLATLPPSRTANRQPNVEGLAIDGQDNLYVTEWFDNLVIKVPAGGAGARIIAGTGKPGFSGDGGPAVDADLNGPSGVTVDASGNVYIADTKNHRLRRITTDGTITTLAGTGTCGFLGDGGPALDASFCLPAETVFDRAGNLIIADYGNRRVRSLGPDGMVTTIAGSGDRDPNLAFQGSSGDGGPAIHATFNFLGGAVFDRAGNLYVSEAGAARIRKITPNGIVSTFAGTGKQGYSGDGGAATDADMIRPGPLAIGPDGALYVITGDSRVRKITTDGRISLVAGTGTGSGLIRSQGDGGPAVDATLNEPGGVAFDQQGNIYIADTSNARVRKIDKNGIITTVAGPGQQGIDYYNAVAVDPKGNVFVAWTHAQPPVIEATVNRVKPDGSLTRVAGSGEPCTGGPGGFKDDGVPAVQARLCAVVGMSVDQNGVLYLSEGGYSLVLRLGADGTIQRVAGNTAASRAGDGGPALEASLVGGQGFSPGPVTFDPAGNLYFPEPGLNIVREVTTAAYKSEVLPDHVSAAGSTPQARTITLSANFAEPFPYQVQVSTADGGSWLKTNRATGLTDELFTIITDPTGLSRGSHLGTVSIFISVPIGATPRKIDIPVSVNVP